MSKLDKDFEKIVIEINAKITEAQLALQEANNLAKKAGLDCLNPYNVALTSEEYKQYDKIEFSKIFDILDDCGWSTSSMNC